MILKTFSKSSVWLCKNSRNTMDAFNREHPSEKYLNFQNVSLMVTSFLAGLYIGKKMSNTVTRVRNLVSTGPSKLVLVVRQDLKMGKGKDMFSVMFITFCLFIAKSTNICLSFSLYQFLLWLRSYCISY